MLCTATVLYIRIMSIVHTPQEFFFSRDTGPSIELHCTCSIIQDTEIADCELGAMLHHETLVGWGPGFKLIQYMCTSTKKVSPQWSILVRPRHVHVWLLSHTCLRGLGWFQVSTASHDLIQIGYNWIQVSSIEPTSSVYWATVTNHWTLRVGLHAGAIGWSVYVYKWNVVAQMILVSKISMMLEPSSVMLPTGHVIVIVADGLLACTLHYCIDCCQ